MSWYFNYYLGYKKDNKIYPLGPYDSTGILHNVFSRSSSFASNLHDEFWDVSDSMISDELRKEFEYEKWDGTKEVRLQYLPITELESTDFIKSGYFLISDIDQYLKNKESYDLFYESITPFAYANLVANEKEFGPPGKKLNDYGEEYIPHSARDYAFFAYPDYESKEYESFLLKKAADSYEYAEILKDAEIVIILTQG